MISSNSFTDGNTTLLWNTGGVSVSENSSNWCTFHHQSVLVGGFFSVLLHLEEPWSHTEVNQAPVENTQLNSFRCLSEDSMKHLLCIYFFPGRKSRNHICGVSTLGYIQKPSAHRQQVLADPTCTWRLGQRTSRVLFLSWQYCDSFSI